MHDKLATCQEHLEMNVRSNTEVLGKAIPPLIKDHQGSIRNTPSFQLHELQTRPLFNF